MRYQVRERIQAVTPAVANNTCNYMADLRYPQSCSLSSTSPSPRTDTSGPLALHDDARFRQGQRS